MTVDECVTGRSVWARSGSTGWRKATIERIGRTGKVHLHCESGTTTHAVRDPACLRPRDLSANGRDKPSVKEAEEAAALYYGG